jgi:hypothetical protein
VSASILPLSTPILFYLLELNVPEFKIELLERVQGILYYSIEEGETEMICSALFPLRKPLINKSLLNKIERTLVKQTEATQAYLNNKIYPVLTKGLTFLCKEKPADPVQWLAQWLLRNNPDSAKVQVQL